MKVYNMESSQGNKVPNQFIIEHKGKEYFQSYNSLIAVKENGKITLDEYYWTIQGQLASIEMNF